MWGYIAVKNLKDPHFIYILKFILVNAIDSCRRKNVTIKCQRERKKKISKSKTFRKTSCSCLWASFSPPQKTRLGKCLSLQSKP